jgi:ornithine cyclodeaminase/alanine dehydrogenase-like protein (mu-crystallin family)
VSKTPILWFTEADVVSMVPLNDAIDALEKVLDQLGRAAAFNVPKALGTFGDGASMHSLGSGSPLAGYVGFKNWVFTKKGATALYVLFSAENGTVVAVIEAAALGQLRTSAISGVATRRMADDKADTLALIGTGKQALSQAIAVALVRDLHEVRIFGRNEERRAQLVRQLQAELQCRVVDASSVEAATSGAAIVTLVTRAEQPFLSASMLDRGAHINAVGAILPKNAEFQLDVFDRCDAVAVDDLAAVQKNSREFRQRFGEGDWSSVSELGTLIAKNWRRAPQTDLTLFKGMGMGVSDLAMAMMVLERGRQNTANRSIPQPEWGAVRWNLR